jgi:hypothetical protein
MSLFLLECIYLQLQSGIEARMDCPTTFRETTLYQDHVPAFLGNFSYTTGSLRSITEQIYKHTEIAIPATKF